MATISETELQRRLRALERGMSASGGGASYQGEADPTDSSVYAENDTWYNSATNNLWIFSGGTWELTSNMIRTRYADHVTNVSSEGTVSNQVDVVGFSVLPFKPNGQQRPWRGIYWGPTSTASTNPTHYEWTYTSGAGSVDVDIYSSNGNVFFNDTGSTTLKANVAIGGELQTNTEHNSYQYKWTCNDEVICVDSNGNVVSDGLGTIFTDTVAVSCQTRSNGYHRADTSSSSASLDFREIILDASDILSVNTLRCEVTNIP